jgi:hypothetical protein
MLTFIIKIYVYKKSYFMNLYYLFACLLACCNSKNYLTSVD